jgi:hypothetical protein
VGLLKNPRATHLLSNWSIQNAIKGAFRRLPPGSERCVSIDRDFFNSPSSPDFSAVPTLVQAWKKRCIAYARIVGDFCIVLPSGQATTHKPADLPSGQA